MGDVQSGDVQNRAMFKIGRCSKSGDVQCRQLFVFLVGLQLQHCISFLLNAHKKSEAFDLAFVDSALSTLQQRNVLKRRSN